MVGVWCSKDAALWLLWGDGGGGSKTGEMRGNGGKSEWGRMGGFLCEGGVGGKESDKWGN